MKNDNLNKVYEDTIAEIEKRVGEFKAKLDSGTSDPNNFITALNKSTTKTYSAMSAAENGLKKYRRNWELVRRKLWEYIPVMIITNLSIFLISRVDSIIAGNFVGKEAFSAVNIFFPVSVFIGAFSTITAQGISTSISTAMGTNDTKEIARVRGASLHITVGMAIFTGLIQIPITIAIIHSYNLSPELHSMTWQYAIGCMISAPFSVISTVGTLLLQIAGKMKPLMVLSISEGVANVVFDLFFVAVLQMGVAGTGYGTLCANLIRCTATVIYLWKKTDFRKAKFYWPPLRLTGSILRVGLPDAAFPVISAIQNYFILLIVMEEFGMDGSVFNGAASFCLSLAQVLILGIQAGTRPLMGLFIGARDQAAVKELLKQSVAAVLIIIGTATALFELFPQVVYAINGIREIPEGGIACLRIYSILFIIRGFTFMIRLYLSNMKDIRFATLLTLFGNASIPVFAFLILLIAPGPFVYLSYTLTEVLVLLLSLLRYRKLAGREESRNSDITELFMTVRPEDAVAASRELRRFADEHGIEKSVSYKIALSMEEMVAYVKSAHALSKGRDDQTSVEVMVRFLDKNNAVFVTLDSGECIALDKDSQKEALITDNYNLIKKLAKEVTYQYILKLNYTTLTFQANQK